MGEAKAETYAGLARIKLFRYKTDSTMTTRDARSRNKSSGKRKFALSKPSRPASYPFSAIVGQDEMKLALILNVIDPLIGGVLIMGHRGTGKSTAVRALADLLPEISVVSGCAYRCDPKDEQGFCEECKAKAATGQSLQAQRAPVSVAELPLGATEDRVCGTIAIERALKDGVKTFEPGLLARANRGFLYIDEVNLLEDHLVDLLLDVAVTGRNKVERESISIEHPARFVLIGSGNPEEGELRPQLVDRFGLHAEVKTEEKLKQRVSIVERCEAFDRDAEAFRVSFAAEQEQLRKRITHASSRFAGVKVDRSLLQQIARLCLDLKVDGHRGELTIMRAARALAAFEERKRVTEEDVKRIAVMSLRHRLRRDVLEETPSGERIERALEKVFADTPRTNSGDCGSGEHDWLDNNTQHDNGGRDSGSRISSKLSSTSAADLSGNGPTEIPSPPALEGIVPKLGLDDGPAKADRSNKTHSSNRQLGGAKHLIANSQRGRYARAVAFKTEGAKIALDATLRALLATSFQVSSSSPWARPESENPTPVLHDAPRFKLFKRKQGTLFIFAIDTSGSMALNRIARAKGAILKLLRQSYINRDSVGIIAFHGKSADLSLPPSRSILRARRVLDSLRMGGSTPLSAGLNCTLNLVKRTRNTHGEIVVLLFTDGHPNVTLHGVKHRERASRQEMIETEIRQLGVELKKAHVTLALVDTQSGFSSELDTRHVAGVLGAGFVRL
jgi:magnesium chelatase subunit D